MMTTLSGVSGLAFVLGNLLLSQLGLPIPAEPTLVLAGANAFGRPVAAAPILLGAVVICVLTDAAWFVAGRRFGGTIPKLLCRISLTPEICASETEVWFESWGANALIVAKFVPGVSLLVPPLAGALQMRWSTFLLRTVMASALWVGVFLGSGYLFGRQILQLIPHVSYLKPYVLPFLATILLLYVVYKWWQRRRFYAAISSSRISVAEVGAMLDDKATPVIVDVRSHTARSLDPWQIPNSVHIVPGEIMKKVGELPGDREIILYCTCPGDASAAQVAGWLIRSGRHKARTLRGGLSAWREAGQPVEAVSREVSASLQNIPLP